MICGLLYQCLDDILSRSLHRAARQVPRFEQSSIACDPPIVSFHSLQDRSMACLSLVPGAISIQLTIAHTAQDHSLKQNRLSNPEAYVYAQKHRADLDLILSGV